MTPIDSVNANHAGNDARWSRTKRLNRNPEPATIAKRKGEPFTASWKVNRRCARKEKTNAKQNPTNEAVILSLITAWNKFATSMCVKVAPTPTMPKMMMRRNSFLICNLIIVLHWRWDRLFDDVNWAAFYFDKNAPYIFPNNTQSDELNAANK